MRFVLALTAAVLLARSASAQVFQTDDQRCQSYGFAPGSQPYAQCVTTLFQRRQQGDWEARYGPHPIPIPLARPSFDPAHRALHN